MGVVKGRIAGPRKLLLYGDHGVGKSSFAASAPEPLFLDIEGGTNDLDVARWDEPIKTMASAISVLNWVYTQEHGFRTLIIDSADWLERLIFNEIAGRSGVEAVAEIDYGKGYPQAVPKWESVLRWLDAIHRERKMMIILLAHAKIERRKNPEGTEYDCYSPGLYTDKKNEGPGKIVQEWCDEVFFIRKKKIVRTEKEGFGRERGIAMGSEDREILASETAWASAKNRLNMPTIVDLPRQNAWSVYMQYIQASRPQKPVEIPRQSPSGDIAGVVIDGSSRTRAESPEIKEMAEMFGR